MFATLHATAAVLFYLLGAALIGGVLLVRNGIGGDALLPVLHSLDLPLAACALLFAGMSFVKSITGGKPRRDVILGVAIPLLIIFVILVYANFFLPTKVQF